VHTAMIVWSPQDVKNFRVAEELSFSRRNLLREIKRDGLNEDLGTVSRRLSLRFEGNHTILCRA
jgi:hypothetical protein